MAQSTQSICYCTIKSQLLISKAAELLSDIDPDKVTKVAPTSPESGCIYIYKSDTEPNQEWMNDGSTWLDTGSVKLSTNDHPLVVKSFHIKDDNGKPSKKFIRTVYCNEQHPTTVLVHYLGQETPDSETENAKEVRDVAERSDYVSCTTVVVKKEESTTKALAIVYGRNNTGVTGISPKEAHHILKNFDICKLSPVAPYRPLPGEIYVYRIPEDDEAKEFWRRDGYSWFSEGRRNYVVDKSNLVKSYFRICLSTAVPANLFRHVFHLLENPTILLVHYLGSNAIARNYSTPPTVKALLEKNREGPSTTPQPYNARKRSSVVLEGKTVEEKAVVYAHRDTLLTNREAHSLLISIDPSKFSKSSPIRPSHGEVYAFRSESSVNNDWVYDGYDWIDRGIQQIKVGNTFLVKMVFVRRGADGADTSPNFVKHAYFALNNPLNVLLHYLGTTPVIEEEGTAEAQYLFIENGKVVLRPNPPPQTVTKKEINVQPQSLEKMLITSVAAFDSSEVKKLNGSLVYYITPLPLTSSQAISILKTVDSNKVSTIVASRPRHDEIYVYKFSSAEKLDLWKHDGFHWKNGGTRSIPTRSPVFMKTYYDFYENGQTVKTFRRHAYRLIDEPLTVLVHYVGQSPPTADEQHKVLSVMDEVPKELNEPLDDDAVQHPIIRKLLGYPGEDPIEPQKPNGALVYSKISEGLSMDEAYSLLQNINVKKVSRIIACRPQPDEVYIYKFDAADKQSWRHDGYPWLHSGVRKFPKINPHIVKAYHQYCEKDSHPTRSFMRHAYNIVGNPLTVLVHYMGHIPPTPSSNTVNTTTDVTTLRYRRSDGTDGTDVVTASIKKKRHYPMGHGEVWRRALSQRRAREDAGEVVASTAQAVENPEQICAIVYEICEEPLELPTVEELLDNIDETRVSQVPPYKPTHGQVFVFKFESPQRKKDWACDGYLWVSMGMRKLPVGAAKFVKAYFQVRGEGGERSKAFVRHAYNAIDNPLVVLVQYLGDDSAFVPRKHGNRKHDDVEHVRTCPSTLAALKAKSASLKPQELFTMMSKISVLPSAMTPRDAKQVRNVRSRLLREQREVKVKEETDASVWDLMNMQVAEEQEVEDHVEQLAEEEVVAESPKPKKKKSPTKKATNKKHDCLASFSGLTFNGSGSAEAYLSRVEAAGRLMGYAENRWIDIVLMTITDDVFDAWYNPVSQPGDTPGDKYAWTEWKNYFLSKYKLIVYETQ